MAILYTEVASSVILSVRVPMETKAKLDARLRAGDVVEGRTVERITTHPGGLGTWVKFSGIDYSPSYLPGVLVLLDSEASS